MFPPAPHSQGPPPPQKKKQQQQQQQQPFSFVYWHPSLLFTC